MIASASQIVLPIASGANKFFWRHARWLITSGCCFLLVVLGLIVHLNNVAQQINKQNLSLQSEISNSSSHQLAYRDYLQAKDMQATLVTPASESQAMWIRELESLIALPGVIDREFLLQSAVTGALEARLTMTLVHEGYVIDSLNMLTQSLLPVEISECEVTRSPTEETLVCRCSLMLHVIRPPQELDHA